MSTTVAGIVNALGITYKPEGVLIWLQAANGYLNGERAIDLLDTAEGRERVRRAVERLGDARPEDFEAAP